MNDLNKKIILAKRIIEGSVTIDSIKEFEGLLQIFPKDPALHRAYSDLLTRKKSYDQAALNYYKSAELFIASGKMLPAILCKMHQWRLKKPTQQEVRNFYSSLIGGNYHETALTVFLNRLSFPEFIALLNRVEQIRLPAGRTIKKIGDVEKALFWIVSGSLKSTIYQPLKKDESNHQKATLYLSENDFFGDIYPFEEQKLSQSYTESASRVELIKLSKSRLLNACKKYYPFEEQKLSQSHTESASRVELIKLSKSRLLNACKKYPNIELGIIDLVNARSNGDDKGILRTVRKTERQKIPLRMNLKIYPDASSHHPVVLDGHTTDVSVGGMCIVLDAKYTNIPAVYKSIKNAKIEISLPGEAMTINVTGTIVWNKEVVFEGAKTVALGIQFEEMSPKLSGLLVVFADMLSG
jgi:CRP-like cAMP-binding protein